MHVLTLALRAAHQRALRVTLCQIAARSFISFCQFCELVNLTADNSEPITLGVFKSFAYYAKTYYLHIKHRTNHNTMQ